MLKFVMQFSFSEIRSTPQTFASVHEDGEPGFSLSPHFGDDHASVDGDEAEGESPAATRSKTFLKYSHESGIDGPGIRSWKQTPPIDQPASPDGVEG